MNSVFWKKIKQFFKEKILRIPNKDYLDLAPIDQIAKETEYIETLRWAIKNKRVKNIALAGPYGSGKSSIIHSYLKSYRFPWQKYIHDGEHLRISMAAFTEISKQENTSSDLGTNEIEKEILKQIFYKVKFSKIPQSRYRKLHKSSFWKTWFYFIIICGFAAGCCFVFWPDAFENISRLILEAGAKIKLNQSKTYLVAGSSFVFLSAVISISWNRFCNRIHLKELKIKDATIAAHTDSSESIFDRYMDELLYFFEVTNYQVVFFEDLDRLETPQIFVELRELNTILNNADSVRKKVTFVYAVKDDIFTDTDRTKFFDFILPVIPTMNSTNSGEEMLRLFKSSLNESDSAAISEAYIWDVSPFIADMRVLNNIYNEFQVYRQTLCNEQGLGLQDRKMLSLIIFKNLYPRDFADLQAETGIVKEAFEKKKSFIQAKNEFQVYSQTLCKEQRLGLQDRKMLSLIIFKNLYPRDFADLQAETGIVKEAFEKKKSFIQSKVDYLNQEIKADLQEIESAKAETHSIQELKASFISEVTGFQGTVNYFYCYPKTIYASTIMSESFQFMDFLINADKNNTVLYYNSWNGSRRDLNWADIQKHFKKYAIRLQNLQNSKNETIKEIQSRIDENKTLIQNLSKMSMQALIKEFGTAELFPGEEHNALLIFMLRRGYIDESYANYMNYFKEESITRNDMNFILNIKNEGVLDFRYPLVKKAQLIRRLQTYEFEQISALNFDLLEELLSKKEYYEKLQAFTQQFSVLDSLHWEFMDQFMYCTNRESSFIQHLAMVHDTFWDQICGIPSISSQRQFEYLNWILGNTELPIERIQALDAKRNISAFITEHRESLQQLKHIAPDRMISIISGLNLSFSQIDIMDVHPEVLDHIFDNGFYALNSDMIAAIVQYKDDTLCSGLDSRNYSTLRELNYAPLLEKVHENLSEYIDNIVTRPGNSIETVHSVIDLICRENHDLPRCDKILKSQEFWCHRLSDPEIFQSDLMQQENDFIQEIWQLLLSYKHVTVCWENVLTYWQRFAIDDFLKSYMIDFCDPLCESGYSSESVPEFENSVIQWTFDPDCFKKLSSAFQMKEIAQVKTVQIPETNLSVLIASKKVPFNTQRYNEIKETYLDLVPDFIVFNQESFDFSTYMNVEWLEALMKDERCSASFKESLAAEYCPNIISDTICSTIAEQGISVPKNLFHEIWSKITSKQQRLLIAKNLSILQAEDFQCCFAQMEEPYASLAERSSRHNVEIPDTTENKAITAYLCRIGYLTSAKPIRKMVPSEHGSFEEERSLIICRVKAPPSNRS